MTTGCRRRLPTPARRALLALVLMSSLCAPAREAAAQQKGGAGAPAADAMPCDAFKKGPDGAWTALRGVTITIGRSHVSVAANSNTLPHAINVNGVDLAQYIDDHCGAAKRPQ